MRTILIATLLAAGISLAATASAPAAPLANGTAIDEATIVNNPVTQVQHWRWGSRGGGHWRWGSRGGGHWRWGSRGGGHWRWGSRGGGHWRWGSGGGWGWRM